MPTILAANGGTVEIMLVVRTGRRISPFFFHRSSFLFHRYPITLPACDASAMMVHCGFTLMPRGKMLASQR
jgi:hypothetical protein